MPYTPDPCEWQHPCKTNWKQEKGLCFEVSSAVDESLQASKWTWCGCFEFVDIAKAVNMHPVSLVAPYSGNQSGPNNPSNNVAQEHIAYNLDSLSVQLVIGNHRRRTPWIENGYTFFSNLGKKGRCPWRGTRWPHRTAEPTNSTIIYQQVSC